MINNLSRRQFIQRVGTASLAASTSVGPFQPGVESVPRETGLFSSPLDGPWEFRLDPQNQGEKEGWQSGGGGTEGWQAVKIPHTWQTDSASISYQGNAWYRKIFEASKNWAQRVVRLEFEAVYHSASVWLNGKLVGQHLRKGYTGFTIDLTQTLIVDQANALVVKVNNSFDESMLPRGSSFDWTMDGGIYRPVNILVTPQVYIERIDVDAEPDLTTQTAALHVTVIARNSTNKPVSVRVAYQVVEEESEAIVTRSQSSAYSLAAGSTQEILLSRGHLSNPRLWHFDHPHMYRLEAELLQLEASLHSLTTTFGVRKIEVHAGAFYLNGEQIWLMGVERMAGSHPDYGMAEPESWIVHDHNDMKELNCVLTRVHWQQDHRVLDYCDRHGILIQEEVPCWGADTFKAMGGEPDLVIMENGLEQLREMIQRYRNHPSIFAWGLCNEINGQNPPAYQFAKRLYEEARRLNPSRLRSYASNTLQSNPDKDVAGLMDFIEWNEYYESWYGGSTESVRKNLEAIHQAFPDKMVVISEYGYCECAPERAPGDEHRIRILRAHNSVFREFDFVGGAIFFCYNDYRTHVGDKGIGALKQRVHGVVDLYGNHKPSFEVLRHEASPIESLKIESGGNQFKVHIATRNRLPAFSLDGYRLRWIVHGYEDLPMEQNELGCPTLFPGTQTTLALHFKEKNPRSIRVDLLQPTGHSAVTAVWKPQ